MASDCSNFESNPLRIPLSFPPRQSCCSINSPNGFVARLCVSSFILFDDRRTARENKKGQKKDGKICFAETWIRISQGASSLEPSEFMLFQNSDMELSNLSYMFIGIPQRCQIGRGQRRVLVNFVSAFSFHYEPFGRVGKERRGLKVSEMFSEHRYPLGVNLLVLNGTGCEA